MMSEKSEAEKTKKVDLSDRNYIVTSAVIGTGLGLAVGLILVKNRNSDSFSDGLYAFVEYTLSGMLVGMLTGITYGIIDRKLINSNNVSEE